jgi:hypothetical protein
VRIATGSQLQLIEEEAFMFCYFLQPVDVPSRTEIRGVFEVVATVHDDSGTRRVRVKFISRFYRH